MKILTVLGTRPEIIKLSPLLPLFDTSFEHKLVHTGQHYDFELDRIFFEGLTLRNPDIMLEVGSSDGLTQTAAIMDRLKPVIDAAQPDLIVVQGDTNSTLAGALAAVKSGVKLAHIEAGCRSFNRQMPEELNRVITDRVADILFAPFEDQAENLRKEGVDKERVFVTGSILTDVCFDHFDAIDQSDIQNRVGLKEREYIVVTIHRAENTDDLAILKQLIDSLNRFADDIDIVFPIHPRTRKAVNVSNIKNKPTLKIINPLGYVDFLKLLSGALFVMTDSGGVQEEAAILNVPGLILREETEWINYVKAGKNKLVGRDLNSVLEAAKELLQDTGRLVEMREADAYIPRGASQEIEKALRASL